MILKNYSLSIALLLLFLFSWGGQLYFQWQEYQGEQKTHNQAVTIEEFLPSFWQATFENWQSEFLQLLTFVSLTAFLIHKGSPESKDSEEEMMALLEKIDRKLAKRK